jgi:hypothetical protein
MMDEKPIELRDQIAISILNGVLSSNIRKNSFEYAFEFLFVKDKSQKEHAHKSIENIVRFSYGVADIVRKVRLSTFE